MKKIILLSLILISQIVNSQCRTRFGSSIGLFKSQNNQSLSVGVQVRREYIRLLYNQLEIHIVDVIDNYQMKVPVTLGLKLNNIRINLGFEVRANLRFTGPNNLGMNKLLYDYQHEQGVYPVVGIGYDFNKLVLDLKLNTGDYFTDITKLQSLLTLTYFII